LSLRLGEFARPYRGNGLRFLWLGRACATLFIAGARMSPRVYYLFPAFPLRFAAGSVMYEMWLEARHRRWRRVAHENNAFAIFQAEIHTPLKIHANCRAHLHIRDNFTGLESISQNLTHWVLCALLQ